MDSAFDLPQPVRPDYGGACLDALAPALMAPPGHRPGWLPAPARDAEQVVLLVLDGLGWEQLQSRLALVPAMADMDGRAITSVVPTTTATALTSVALGQPPARHGVVGYRLRVPGPTGDEVLNVLRWRTVSGDARPFLAPAEFQPAPAFAGAGVPVVTRAEFLTTGFTVAHLSGTRQVGWWVPSGIPVEVGGLLESGERFVYAYYDGVDKVAHISGFGRHYDAELVAADRLVADLRASLPAGAALVVTADHGQVEVGAGAAPVDAAVAAETLAMSGEGRFRWLHARPGRAAALADAARDRYRHEAWVLTIDELDEGGWYGGPLTPAMRQRLGDVALVPFLPVAYQDPADTGEMRLVCRHGSLTSAEMLVPCLAASSFGSGPVLGKDGDVSDNRVQPDLVLPGGRTSVGPQTGDGGEGEQGESVAEPAKVMRIGSMIKQLLEEVRQAPLDEASRGRLREIYDRSIQELASGLSPDLQDELKRMALPFGDDRTPSDAELRIAQAQLVGWLEGLFHGIQAMLYAQQMAARNQLEEMRRRGLPAGEERPMPTGTYL